MFARRRSIRHALLRLIGLAVLTGIGLSLLSNALVMLDNVRGDIRRTLVNAATAAGTAASAAVLFRDGHAAGNVLRMFEAYPEVESAALYDGRGNPLAVHGAATSAQRARGAPALPRIGLLAEVAELRQPILVDGEVAGAIYVRARLDRYWRTWLTTTALHFLVALAAGALALVLAMRFLQRIIQPVRMLAEAADDARLRQDFRRRNIPAADDEIGDLARNFNDLLAEVEKSRASLRGQQQELERQVATRTAELSAAKDAADAANAAKSRFLAAASHDLRQPIHAIRLFLDTLRGTELNAEQRRLVAYLSQSAGGLADILNALLDVSRLEGGGVAPRMETLSVMNLLQAIEAEFAPLALAKGLRFQFFFPDRELRLSSDQRLLFSLLRNLIDNAIKYTQQGGVLVGFRRRPGRVLIQVWDTGVGIAPEHMERIFDEYFQVGNPQRDRGLGLGLGLSIVRRAAALLGCTVDCRSRPGRGSRFQISVPLAQGEEAPARADAPRIAAPREACLAGRRIVLVEDDALAAKAMELVLAGQGARLCVHATAEAALAREEVAEADFLVVDFRLPGMNGAEFLERLQARSPRPLRALILTGESNHGALPAGLPWKVLFKPVDSAALIAEIEALRDEPFNAARH